MPSYTGRVTIGINDWNTDSSTETRLEIAQTPAASISTIGGARLDTNISGGTVTGATIYWYDHSYVKSKNTTYQGTVLIRPDDLGFTEVYSFTSWSTGWKSHALTSGELSEINTTGNTELRFSVDEPSFLESRNWNVRAYEYTPTGTYSAYIVIDYSLSGLPEIKSRRSRIFII